MVLLPYLSQGKIPAGFPHITVDVILNGIPAIPPGLVFNRCQAVNFRQAFLVEPSGKRPPENRPP